MKIRLLCLFLFLLNLVSVKSIDLSILIIGSRSEITKNRVLDTKSTVLRGCEEEKVSCHVIDLVNDFPDKQGLWTVFGIFSILRNLSDWYLIVEDSSEIRISNFKKFIESKSSGSRHFYGFSLIDKEPTIIHHFGFKLPADFEYPLFAAGALISRKVVSELKNNFKNEKMPNFAIDPKHEFAVFLHEKLNVRMENKPEIFCNKEVTSNCLVAARKKDSDLGETNNSLDDDNIYVMIKTFQGHHKTRIPVIQSTWTRHLPNLEYCSDVADPDIPTVDMNVGNQEKGHCAKTWAIFKRFLERGGKETKWLLVADDDTLISWERLKRMLGKYDEKQKIIIGERYGFGFSFDEANGYDYPTGGSGMIFTKTAVEAILKTCPECSSPEDPDDMVIGMCALMADVPIIHNHQLHQARPQDYAKEYLDSPISFHKFNDINPRKVYVDWLKDINEHEEITKRKYEHEL